MRLSGNKSATIITGKTYVYQHVILYLEHLSNFIYVSHDKWGYYEKHILSLEK